eukprot:scaffold2353_cov167-Amphora_coffeaeformis.AAC.45
MSIVVELCFGARIIMMMTGTRQRRIVSYYFMCLVICVGSAVGFLRSCLVDVSRRHRQVAFLSRDDEPTIAMGKPIDPKGWPMKFPAQEHCSRCGLCESSYVSYVKEACSFLPDGMMKSMDDHGWEARVHERGRYKQHTDVMEADELRFGVLYEPMYLARGNLNNPNDPYPQWTGVVSSIAESMLEDKLVDAVVCIGTATSDVSSLLDWATPEPLLARTVQEVRQGRGVKPSLAPTLRVLDEIRRASDIQSLLVCGVGCAVQAFRAVEAQLRRDNPSLRDIFVLGTNCADNSPTPRAAQNFIERGILQGITTATTESIRGYEFMTDFKIHVKTDNGYLKRPYFCLPPSLAAPSIAPSCLACFDYTNALADVVVGYMGAPTEDRMDQSWQTLTIRNARGRRMVDAALQRKRLTIGEKATGSGKHEAFALSTVQSDAIVQDMSGNPVDKNKDGLPVWLGNIMAQLLQAVGPKGVSFARYSIDYHLLRNYLHVLSEWGPDEVDHRIPDYARRIVGQYRSEKEMFQRIENEVLKHSAS